MRNLFTEEQQMYVKNDEKELKRVCIRYLRRRVIMQKWNKFCLAAILALGCLASVMAVEVPTAEWERMKQQIAELQSSGASTPNTSSMVDTAMDCKYGPNAPVTTKVGKLQIGGLVQVWYYSIQQDRKGFFNDPGINAIADSNAANHNGFRIRRAELWFKEEINESISATVMIDPAREAAGFPNMPSNQGNDKKGNQVSPQFAALGNNGLNDTSIINAAQHGAFVAGAPTLLQDAYINFHGVIPYHDFQIGQYRPWIGEEGLRSNAELDFVERSMVGFQGNNRDLGASLHGSFWGQDCNDRNGRLQYWAGVFDGGASYFDPGQAQNKPDNNNSKDFNARLLIRPIWNDCWGKLEIGGSFMGGKHGDGRNETPQSAPLPGLNQPSTYAVRYNAWTHSQYTGFLKGLWTRNEYTFIRDREVAGSVLDAQGNGTGTNAFAQEQGRAFSKQGYTSSIGYRLGESKMFCNGAPIYLKGLELVGRYDHFQNIDVANVVTPYRTDRFYTTVYTAGLNYYIKGSNAKIQANYNFVN
jgi:hypothetical protein